MASTRENLFAQVRTDLLGINGVAPYTNTIRSVERDLATEDQIGTYPTIVMVEEDQTTERIASSREHFFEARLMLLVYAKETPGTSASTLLNSLFADVWIAMMSTTNWNHQATCHRTIFQGWDPLAVKGVSIVGAVINFAFHISHTWDAP